MVPSRLPTCNVSRPGPCPRTSADGEYTRRNSYGRRKLRLSENVSSMTREAWWSLISVGIGVLESRPAMAAVAQNGRRLAYHGRRAGRPARDFAANYRANFWLSTLVLLHDVEIAEAGHDIRVFR